MSQRRLECADEGDAMERGEMCHCKDDVDKAELNCGGYALDGPTLPHSHRQQRNYKLILISHHS